MVLVGSSSKELQMRLTIFRRTLACLLDKAVVTGGEEIASPEVAYQLKETRCELERLERKLAKLQSSGQYV